MHMSFVYPTSIHKTPRKHKPDFFLIAKGLDKGLTFIRWHSYYFSEVVQKFWTLKSNTQ